MKIGRALILDPGSPTALAAVRALGSAGWQVGVGWQSPKSVARYSRWCSFRHEIVKAQDSLQQFADSINRAVEANGYDLVFGCGDLDVFALSHCREAIRTCVPFPTDESIRRAFDKYDIIEIAKNAGVGMPVTCLSSSSMARQLKPPIIVKPRWHWTPNSEQNVKFGAQICHNIEDAFSVAENMNAGGAPVVFQEFHEGWYLTVSAVADRTHRPLIMVQQETREMWPLNVGWPARNVTMRLDEQLEAGIARMLERLEWFGLMNMQFIVPEDGVPRLFDFNGRPYMTQSLALGAGVNFMDIWARVATGKEPIIPQPAKPGIRYQDFVRDIFRIRDIHGWNPLKFLECLVYSIGAKHPYWRADDPKPFIHRYWRLTRRQIAKIWRRSS